MRPEEFEFIANDLEQGAIRMHLETPQWWQASGMAARVGEVRVVYPDSALEFAGNRAG